MSKNMKQGLVPELRFPEFRDAGTWRSTKLIDVADKNVKWSFIGGPFGSNLKSSDYVPEGVRVIQLQNIGDAEFMDDYKIFTSKEKANELLSNNIYPGDIILSKMGDPVGRACLIPGTHSRYVMCSDGIRLVVDKDEFSKYFIYILINSDLFRALVEKTATGSTRKRIGLDDLKKLPLIVPKLKEQHQIADCLSSLDELITAHTQKHQALQSYKKGLMQNLFPAEGEKVPVLRFPEFEGTGQWIVEELGDKTIKVGSGITPKGGDKNYLKDGVPFVRSQNIGWGHFILQNIAYIDEATHSTFPSTEINAGDVLLNITGASIGRCAVADQRVAGGNVNQHVCIIRTKKRSLKPYFLNQFILSCDGQNQIDSFQAGGNRQGLNFSQIKSFLIPIPPQIKEQQRIADFLFSVDELIAAQAQKIKQLKAHKKGLMQKLLIAMAEVIS